MMNAPKSLRLQIGIFGRTNVGKSSFLNLVAGQDVAITSPIAGTTTDVVEKCMEFLPLGPVVFLDTAGIDDVSVLSPERKRKTEKIFNRADIIVLIAVAGIWTEFEERIIEEAKTRKLPLLVVINKTDAQMPPAEFVKLLADKKCRNLLCSCVEPQNRNKYINEFKRNLLDIAPEAFLSSEPLIEDLVPAGGLAVLIVPIDLEAPKGRIILPQVQAIRSVLDNNAAAVVVKESEYSDLLKKFNQLPDIVVCDSQVSLRMVQETPAEIPCTTFSILFARYKGDFTELVKGARAVAELRSGDRVLIAESCSHHPIEGDIGREKIPRWLEEFSQAKLEFSVCSGRDFPDDLSKFKLIVACGGCMLTRREMLYRIHRAKQQNIPITNYGMCIAATQGILERVIAPLLKAKQDSGVAKEAVSCHENN